MYIVPGVHVPGKLEIEDQILFSTCRHLIADCFDNLFTLCLTLRNYRIDLTCYARLSQSICHH